MGIKASSHEQTSIATAWNTATFQSSRALANSRVGQAVIVTGLYILALLPLLFRLDSHLPFAYNWEDYTAWRFFSFWDNPSFDIFRRNDGLMTDSGTSPLLALPVWIGFALFGPGLNGLRVPVVLIAAAAVPLLWLLARRILGGWTAMLAAVLLALSPVFLLYGRTATTVGMSLVPALATMYVLWRVLEQPRDWRWIAGLQVLLLVSIYAYAPTRFLWPLSLVLLILAIWRREKSQPAPYRALLVTALVLPTVLLLTPQPTDANAAEAIFSYYNARGEQLAGMIDDPASVPLPDDQGAAGAGTPITTGDLLGRLIVQNTVDFVKLHLDIDTRPAIMDYWNPHGRLYPAMLVPFFLLGLWLTLWGAVRRRADLFLLLLFLGFGLPMLLTTQVHIGRLIFELPLLLLITARGFSEPLKWIVEFVARERARRTKRVFKADPAQGLHFGLALALVLAVGWQSLNDFKDAPASTAQSRVAEALRNARAELMRPGVAGVLVLGGEQEREIESIHIADMKLSLLDAYSFIDLRAEPEKVASAGDGRPVLYYGGLLDLLEDGLIPGLCNNTYFVDETFGATFGALNQKYSRTCGRDLRYEFLPR